MFLYLSKLLPLLFYPLGLACILMVVALVNLAKQKGTRTATVAISMSLTLLLVGGNGWVSRQVVRSLEWQNIPSELPNTEAIVVLGGSTKPALPPRPGVDLSEQGDRVIYAAQLYRQKKAPFIILSGGRIEWSGGGSSESKDMATILTSIGVPAEVILEDPDSLNTYQNAVNVKKILQARNFHQVLLVTSAIHMPRSLMIFHRLGMDVIPAPTDFLVSYEEIKELGSSPKSALLNLVPDSQRLYEFTGALKEYVGILIYRLRGWA